MLRSRFRRWPFSSKVYAGLAAVCALAAFALVRAEAERVADGSARGVQVVVAARPLQAGATITAGDLTLGSVAQAPPAALDSVQQAVGHTAVTPFLPGEPVTRTRLAETGGALTALVPPGQVGMVLVIQNVPEGLAAGDRVDVLATFAAARPYTSLVAENVQVVKVSTSEGFGGSEGDRQVMLGLDPETARGVAQANATGVLAMVVRGYVPLAG